MLWLIAFLLVVIIVLLGGGPITASAIAAVGYAALFIYVITRPTFGDWLALTTLISGGIFTAIMALLAWDHARAYRTARQIEPGIRKARGLFGPVFFTEVGGSARSYTSIVHARRSLGRHGVTGKPKRRRGT
jgi:hypothetical protein